VVGEFAGAVAETRSASEFRRLTSGCSVVGLPPGFARQEAGDAAERVLEALGGRR